MSTDATPDATANGQGRAPDLVDLESPVYLDKVMGCWVGKSAGGTLGQPLEDVFGDPEPFDVWWYPELPEGGIPNDDFELHLIFLKALEEVGTDLRAEDLARYWLAYTGYNWDEYGLSKANHRLGLRPPLSGSFNNTFVDCMGCSVRSEIWACIAPGDPNLAVRYAYEDAICDHAGGEGVYGELFNAAVQSAAFLVSDRDELLDIGLSFIPPASATAHAIEAVREARAAGRTWLEARSAVLAAAPGEIAQYSPVNMGFVVVGWLYGTDFGDALCKTVNCGYDTDSSGATLGATLGIVLGRSGLPPRWIDPIGEDIPTNESWGGVRNMGVGPNPVPTTLTEFTARVARVATQVRATIAERDGSSGASRLHADEASTALRSRSVTTTQHDLGVVRLAVDYGGPPAVREGERRTFELAVSNPQPDAVEVRTTLSAGAFDVTLPEPRQIPAGGTERLRLEIRAPEAAALENSNTLHLIVRIPGWPAPGSVPLVLIGARRFRVAGPYGAAGDDIEALMETAFAPETREGSALLETARAGDWRETSSLDHGLPLPEGAGEARVDYVQAFLDSPRELPVRIGVSSNAGSRLWVNDEVVVTAPPLRVRPSLEGYGQQYGDAVLRAGWNEVLVKIARAGGSPEFEGYLLLSDPARLFSAFSDIGWTRFPWDE